MNETEKRVLIAVHDEPLGKNMEKTLTRVGYVVRRVNTSYAALAALESAQIPFAIIISSYRMPRMGGDELLRNAKEVAPDTQRVLLIDSHETETVVNAVNRAGIHSCIVLPYQTEVFVSEMAHRFDHFDRIQKKNRLLKVTRHQNQQLYKVAMTLKEKQKAFDRRIQKKKRALEALKRVVAGESEHEALPDALALLLQTKGVAPTKVAFQKALKWLSLQLQSYLKFVFFTHDADLDFEGNVGGDALFSDACLTTVLLSFIDHELTRLRSENVSHLPSDGPLLPKDKSDKENWIVIEPDRDNLSGRIYISEGIPAASISLEMVKEKLKKEGITHGVVADGEIVKWLDGDPIEKTPLLIAVGTPPLLPVHATVHYHFDVNYLHVGKIDADGNIDFKERGDTPFVKADTLLATKSVAQPGTDGMDIFGEVITVAPPEDILFVAGNNTRLSEDALKIVATAEGRPHLDAMGTVSVYPEMRINGDVDYETGNINFNGNLVVSGTIREGFSVRCANLTVDQIHGAEVNITGNLNVSSGIIDADVINVQGNIQARYINNSKIKGFRDVIVQREILDSRIFAGGACINENGVVISSFINAKGGIRSGTVGRIKAPFSTLEVGTDGLIEMIVAELDERMERAGREMALKKKGIEDLEAEEHLLHERISQAAYIQDRSQIELRDIQRKMPGMEQSTDLQTVNHSLVIVSELKMRAGEAEDIINDAFERQNAILEEIQTLQRHIRQKKENNGAIAQKKKAILNYSKKMPAIAEVRIKRSILAGTKVFGKKSRVVLKDDLGACRIHEVRSAGRSTSFPYVMRFSPLN